MREIRANILECYERFQLISIGVSVYQKKDGTTVVPKEGLMRDIVTKWPDLPKLIGNAVAKYGNCPSIVYSIPQTKFPTKIMSFPITPTSLRVETPAEVVIARLAKRFKPYTLLPGWLLRPRLDMIEFSCIKLAEIIKYYKLSEVALLVDTLGLGEGDEKYWEVVRELFLKYFNQYPVTLLTLPNIRKEEKNVQPEVVQTVSNASYIEDTTEEES